MIQSIEDRGLFSNVRKILDSTVEPTTEQSSSDDDDDSGGKCGLF
jgi:hypothetical protein